MRHRLAFAVCLSLANQTAADETNLSSRLLNFADCMPPTTLQSENEDECDLTGLPKPIRQEIEVSECTFYPGYEHATFWPIECLVANNSKESIESINYGVRYLENGGSEFILESGYEDTLSLRTQNIDGSLHPGEQKRLLIFSGPAVQTKITQPKILPIVEVFYVSVPGSMLRR